MAKLLLIDHSLRTTGGHHYEYAMQVLHAADRAGYRVFLATHRQFKNRGKLPGRWQTFPLFPHDTYSPHCLYFSKVYRVPAHSTFRSWLAAGSRLFRHVRGAMVASTRQRHRRQFTDACRELLQCVALQAGDHVFIPTMSEFDLAGLIPCLRELPEAGQANWHLQFHFDVFEGRDPEYVAQPFRHSAMRDRLAEFVPQMPVTRTHFYTTTSQLAAQYNRLDVTTFQPLPYPASRDLCPREDEPAPRRLRVTCAGYLRREKGRHHLRQLIEMLWPQFLSTGQLQLVLQCRPEQLRRLVPARIAQRLAAGSDPHTPLRCVAHPLSPASYTDFIRDSHIGLFLYDSRRYYARCSGILVEMLSAGVPVIVPAGCWLAEQLSEENFRYLDQLPAQLSPPLSPVSRLEISATASQSIELSWPRGAIQMLVRFRTTEPRPGTYVRLQPTFQDADGGQQIGPVQIVSTRHGQLASTIFDLTGTSARLAVASAYPAPGLAIAELSVRFVMPLGDRHTRYPHGRVGLTSANPSEVPRLIQHMANHYSHYRETAREFSHSWRSAHRAERVLKLLQRNAKQGQTPPLPNTRRAVPVAGPHRVSLAGVNSPE